jgi:hypothetical protein
VSGPVGGPFNASPQVFSLTNLSGSVLNWNILNIPSWLSATATSGLLPPAGTTNVTISLSATANSLAAGVYTNNLLVTNAYGLAATLPFSLSVGQPLIANGGFETGDFTGWSLSASAQEDFVTSTGSFVHSGVYGAELGQPTTNGYLSQTISTTPGQSYVLSFWLDNPNNSAGATPNQFQVQWNGTTVFYETNLPFMSWTNVQFIVSATGASTVLQFGFYDTPAYLGLDDVSLQPLSAPVFKTVQPGSAASAFDLTWTTVPGVYYQVQYTTNLAQTNWVNLGPPILASTNSVNFSDTNAVDPSRYYRINLVP